jgi:hypothetical protein
LGSVGFFGHHAYPHFTHFRSLIHAIPESKYLYVTVVKWKRENSARAGYSLSRAAVQWTAPIAQATDRTSDANTRHSADSPYQDAFRSTIAPHVRSLCHTESFFAFPRALLSSSLGGGSHGQGSPKGSPCARKLQPGMEPALSRTTERDSTRRWRSPFSLLHSASFGRLPSHPHAPSRTR